MKIKIPFTKKVFELRSSLANPTEWLLKILTGGSLSKSGINVSAGEAMQLSAVYACVKVIAETIAMLPCTLYQRQESGKKKAENDPLYWILHNLPNHETTAFDFWLMYIVNFLLTGDAFAWTKRDGNGQIIELWNIPSGNVTIYRNDNTKELFYKVHDGSKEAIYYPEEIMHTRGMRFTNNDTSINPISMARDALGLAMALEEYASKYFANGAQPSGIVETGKLTDTAFERFKADFLSNYAAAVNTAKILFLEDGAKFTKISNNPAESQALEAREFQIIEICRFFNVPPSKVFELKRATWNNIEQLNIEFVQICIGPICVRIEQSIYKDLIPANRKRKQFAKFITNALLRGDTAARKEYYNTMIQNGVFSPNDVLEFEDMNTYEGGDVHMVNGNMIPVSKLEELLDSKIKLIAQKGGEKKDEQNTK